MEYWRFFVQGVVQGVGFRPYIYNAAIEHHLTGYVQNTGTGVVIVANNKQTIEEILKHIPPNARIDYLKSKQITATYNTFEIKESDGVGFAEIPPDLFLCPDCQKELHDSSNRRYGYFFITCTNCGPRYSMTQGNPYDRLQTTMRDFPMCSNCQKEYTDPTNRRYHAQTIACPTCGPQLTYCDSTKKSNTYDPLSATITALKHNQVVAIKGVGGFHWVCRTTPKAVASLRKLSNRNHKPYALMVKDCEMAASLCQISAYQQSLLESSSRPIVVCQKHDLVQLNHVSELDSLGLMLPYSGLHYLLFDQINEPLVMTSANVSGQPITSEVEQQPKIPVLNHNRQIANPIDDSVIKPINNQTCFLRRSRGFVPASISVNSLINQTILAMGAETNNTFAIYHQGKVYLSPYVGNVSNVSIAARYQEYVTKYLNMLHVTPDVVVIDKHPEYEVNKYGQEIANKYHTKVITVQHHLAHMHSVMLEQSLSAANGIIMDGTGYGDDGTNWGGEAFINHQRIGSLQPQLLLGGDVATNDIKRLAFAMVSKQYREPGHGVWEQQLQENFNCPITTSTGRVLDAAAYILGLCDDRDYDGRAAMLLESCAGNSTPYDFPPIINKNQVMTTPLIDWVFVHRNDDKHRIAATVQQYLIQGLAMLIPNNGLPTVFSGGCAANSAMNIFAQQQGILSNEKVPCGDGGIAFGQIGYYLANARHD